MWEIVGAMKGLRRLQVDVNLNRFDVFQPTMTSSDQQRKERKRLREVLELGIAKTAEMELHVANRVKDGEARRLEWRHMPEGKWKVRDWDIFLDVEIEEWFEKMVAFKVLFELGRKAW